MRILLAAAALALAAAGTARADDIQAVLGKMEQRERDITSVSFDFSQRVSFAAMTSTTEVAGVALFKKPGKMRVEKKTPDQQLTISNGRKVWVYNPAFKQAWEGKMQSWLEGSSLPKGLIPLQDYVRELRRGFDLSLKAGAPDGKFVTVAATPKNADLGYTLELKVSRESWLPVQTVFRSESATVVTDLSVLVINPPAPESRFTFQPPAGTDVISMN